MNVFGFWYIESMSRKEWNCMGHLKAQHHGYSMPQEMKTQYDKLLGKYGNPPIDLKWGVHPSTGETNENS